MGCRKHAILLYFHTAYSPWSPSFILGSCMWVAGRHGGSPRVSVARCQQITRRASPRSADCLVILHPEYTAQAQRPFGWLCTL